jgi:acid phosphatase (class A)
MKRFPRRIVITTALSCSLVVAGVLASGVWRGGLPGYGAGLDYRTVIGPPPAPGSAAAGADRAAISLATAAIGGPAWQAASHEIFPTSDAVRAEVSCAIGHRLAPNATPATMRLIERAAADLQPPVEAAKADFARDRPFVGADDPRSCDLRTLGALGKWGGGLLSYSYPSGHAAFGQLAALVLADAEPARAAPLAAWGTALGDHRVACRVHWPSDIAAGRRLATAVHARLAALRAYRADVAAARTELRRAPAADCRPRG